MILITIVAEHYCCCCYYCISMQEYISPWCWLVAVQTGSRDVERSLLRWKELELVQEVEWCQLDIVGPAFNHHLRKNFLHILGDVADIDLGWTMFKASIAEAVFKSCDQNVTVPVWAARTRWVDICVSLYLATVGKFTLWVLERRFQPFCQALDSGIRSSLVFTLAVERWTSSLPSRACWARLGNLQLRSTPVLWTWRRLMNGSPRWFCGGHSGNFGFLAPCCNLIPVWTSIAIVILIADSAYWCNSLSIPLSIPVKWDKNNAARRRSWREEWTPGWGSCH